jgi:hypothetical protein
MTGPEKPAPWPRNRADPARHRVRRYRSVLSAHARTWSQVLRTNERRDAIRDPHSKRSPCHRMKCTNRRPRRPLRRRRLRLARCTANCSRHYRERYSSRCRAVLDSKARRVRRIEDMSVALPRSRSRRSCRRLCTSSTTPRSTAGRSLRSCRSPRRHRRRLHRQRRSCRCSRPRHPQSLHRCHHWHRRPSPRPLRRSRQHHRRHFPHHRPRLHRFHPAKLHHRPRLHRPCRLGRRSLLLRHRQPSRLRSHQRSRRDRRAPHPRRNRAIASVWHRRRNTRPSGPTRGSGKPTCPRP